MQSNWENNKLGTNYYNIVCLRFPGTLFVLRQRYNLFALCRLLSDADSRVHERDWRGRFFLLSKPRPAATRLLCLPTLRVVLSYADDTPAVAAAGGGVGRRQVGRRSLTQVGWRPADSPGLLTQGEVIYDTMLTGVSDMSQRASDADNRYRYRVHRTTLKQLHNVSNS